MPSEIICVGQALVDCLFRGWDRKSQIAEAISLQLGGDAFNKAIMMARLGHSVCLRAGVGDDFAGHALLAAAEKEGVSTFGSVVSSADPTPVSALFVNDDGSRASTLSRAHMIPFFSPSIDEAEGGRAVVLSSLFRPPFEDPDVLLSLTSTAKASGMAIYVDVKQPKAKKFALSDFSEALSNVDCIFPNQEEAVYFTGESDPAHACDVFLRTGVRNVIVKLGAGGALHMGENGYFHIPAWDTPVADGVGAGDAFAAGFICGILEGMSARQAAELASVCSAICISEYGAISGLKSRAQVDAWLNSPPVKRL